MKFILFAVAVVSLASTAAQAEIICTNRGCYETGMRIFRNGGAYRGLAHYDHHDMAQKQGLPTTAHEAGADHP